MKPLSEANQNLKKTYMNAKSSAKNSNTEDWVEKLARFGFIAKGTIYCLIGILATMAAFGISGGEKTGRTEIFKIIYEQPFGRILLAILALGLFSYMIWRLVEAIKNPDGIKNDAKGKIKRIGYGLSGLLYGGAAVYAMKMVIDGGSSSGGGNGREMLISKALSLPMGQWIVGLVALGIIGKGIFQLYTGFTAKYMKDIESVNLEKNERKAYKRAGRFGFISRGIVFLIIGYFMGRAAIEYNPDKAKGTEEALSFLQGSSYGPYLLGAVAIGLIAYGVFMFVKARYKRFNT